MTPPLPTDAIERCIASWREADGYEAHTGDANPDCIAAISQLRALRDAALVARWFVGNPHASDLEFYFRADKYEIRRHLNNPVGSEPVSRGDMSYGLPVLDDAARRALGETP